MADSKILDFVEQPNDYTCQAACIAKVLGTDDVMSIRRELESIGKPGSPATMGQVLMGKVKHYHYSPIGSLNEAAKWCDEPDTVVITHGWFTGSGHVITLVRPVTMDNGWQGFTVDDPWYEFNFPQWNFTQRTGDDVVYSRYGLYAACVVGSDVNDAYRIYKRKELDSGIKNAWMHFIQN